ncbi:hypothetical protein ACP70R_030515 [Stipagrostis hirtigluma subsp. patula]
MAVSWTMLVLERMVEVIDRCGRGRQGLTTAFALLALPTHVADAPEVRARLELVRGMLRDDASVEIALAASAVTAAELVALRGAADNPANPLPSIYDIPVGFLFVRLALDLVQVARLRAYEACDAVQRCCGHLTTAVNLLDHPDLPGVDGLIDAERVAAHGDLDAAKDLTLISTVLAVAARWLVVLGALAGVNN